MTHWETILIQGLGLIGGSFAHLIREIYPDSQCIGVDSHQDTLQFALENGLIQRGYNHISQVQEHPHLSIVCTPLATLKQDIEAVSKQFFHSMVITDVGSVKGDLSAETLTLNPKHTFVSGHPMAGTEKNGIQSASIDLLKGATHLLIGTKTDVGESLEKWFAGLGLKPRWLSLQNHDKWVAKASHLPYLMATITASLALDEEGNMMDDLKGIVSSGFRDTTRVASMASEWGVGVCSENRKEILKGLKQVSHIVDDLKGLLETGDMEGLNRFFTRAKNSRENLIG